MKKILVLLLLVSTMAVCQETTKLPIDAFENKLKQTPTPQLIDVRTPAEFANGRLENALNLDLRNDAFAQRADKLDKTKPVFVYCLSGGRSAAATQTLRDRGFKEVYDMQGGFAKWLGAGKPFVKSKGAVATAKEISKADFEQIISNEQPVFIDFFAPWCAPCQKMLPTVEGFKSKYEGKMTVQTINFDDNKTLAKQLGVDEVPTILIYAKGKLLWRGIGFMTTEMLQKAVDEQLALIK